MGILVVRIMYSYIFSGVNKLAFKWILDNHLGEVSPKWALGKSFFPPKAGGKTFPQGKLPSAEGGWQNFLSGKSFLALTLPKESISLPLGNLIPFMGMGNLKLFPK